MPDVSVIIPTYNRLGHLQRAVASALEDGCASGLGVEVIVVDDGSADGSAVWLGAHPDPRVRVIAQANAGPQVARNCGLDAAAGTFVRFLDSDDWLVPGASRSQADALTASGADVAYGEATDAFEGNEATPVQRPTMGPTEDVVAHLLRPDWLPPFGYLYRRATLVARWREDMASAAEDWAFVLDVALGGGRFVYTPVLVGCYFQHSDDRLSTPAHPRAWDEARLDTAQRVVRELTERGAWTPLRRHNAAATAHSIGTSMLCYDAEGFARCMDVVNAVCPGYRPDHSGRRRLAAAVGLRRAEPLILLWRQIRTMAAEWLGTRPVPPRSFPSAGQLLTHYSRISDVGIKAIRPSGNSRAPRVLVAADFPPYPTTSGRAARLAAVLDALEEIGVEADFLYLHGPPPPPELAERLGRRAVLLHVPSSQALGHRVAGFVRAVLGDPWTVRTLDQHLSGRLMRALAERFVSAPYDVVWVNYFYLSRLFDLFPAARHVLDTHDRFADRRRAVAAAGINEHWLTTNSAVERKSLRRADVVVAIQQDEARYFREAYGVEVAEIGHITEPVEPLPLPASPVAVFVGGEATANVAGVRWFYDEVLPRVLRAVPGFRLLLVGQVAEHVGDSPHVLKVPHADDLPALYAQAQVAINPQSGGTGLSIKNIEALSYGRPLVARPGAVRGLPLAGAQPETQGVGPWQVADGPEDFAAAVVGYLTDAERLHAAAAAARAWAERYRRRQLATLREVCGVALEREQHAEAAERAT